MRALQLRVGADADIAGIVRMVGRKQHGAAERGRDRQVEALGEARARARRPSRVQPRAAERSTTGALAPPTAASAGRPSAVRPGQVSTGSTRGRRRRPRVSSSMSSGSAITTGPGRPCMATWKARETIRGCGRRRRSRRPIWPSSRRRPCSRPPGTRRAPRMPRSTWPTNRISGVEILLGDVDAVRGVGGAGAARDEGDAGPAGEPRRGLGHHRRAALLPADRDVRSRRRAARRARRDSSRPARRTRARRPARQGSRR